MKSVFAVEGGDFDNFHIRAIFSTEEKAQAFLDHFHKDNEDFCIAEYPIDEIFNFPKGKKIFNVNIAVSDGTVIDIFGVNPYINDCHVELNHHPDGIIFGHAHNVQIPEGWVKERRHNLDIYRGAVIIGQVWAKDEEEAKQIANEERKKYL